MYSRIQCMYDAHGSPMVALDGALVVRDVIFSWPDLTLLTSRNYINERASQFMTAQLSSFPPFSLIAAPDTFFRLCDQPWILLH